MSSDLQDLRDMVSAVLAKRLPTPQMIRDHIHNTRKLFPSITDEQAERLAMEFEHIHGVTMDVGSTLEGAQFEKWLDDARSGIHFFYWERYRQLLAERHFSGQVLATLDRITERTLGLLENP
jgi:hypothetical protein